MPANVHQRIAWRPVGEEFTLAHPPARAACGAGTIESLNSLRFVVG